MQYGYGQQGQQGQHGQLDIMVAHNPAQWMLTFKQPTIEIDGQQAMRPWGRHLFDLWPGQHTLRVWFPSLMGQGGLAMTQIGIWPGHATMFRYDTPFFIFMAGTLQMLGSRPMGAW